MLIKKVKLHNIRSYVDAEISFNEGKTLIAGDIGAGKSTILLAIEFALFGFIKGDISGSMLLRHGANEGFVELEFEVDKMDVIVHRSLKRSAKGIDQDSGFMVRDGKKEPMTPTELKAIILLLLGYPEELIAKSKSLLFRYTVYTPQEDMKRILLGDKDERLSIIRRLFGIDKYKRIQENSDIYARHVREQLRELAGKTTDLDDKKKQCSVIETEITAINRDIEKETVSLTEAKKKTVLCRDEVVVFEVQQKKWYEAKQSLDACNITLKHFEQEKTRLVVEKDAITKKSVLLQAELPTNLPDKNNLKQELLQKNNELIAFEKERFSLHGKRSSLETMQRLSGETMNKIKSLDTCPLCLQQVTDDHKQHILLKESEKVKAAVEEQNKLIIVQKEYDARIELKKKELDEVRLKDKTVEILCMKQQQVVENQQQLEKIEQRMRIIDDEHNTTVNKKMVLEQSLITGAFDEAKWSAAKQTLDRVIQEERVCELKLNVLKEKKSNVENNKTLLDKEIATKEVYKKQANNLKRFHEWLQELFYPLVGTIEKHVLAQVYGLFDELFRQWFSMLIDDEMFSARLDDSFAPVLQQNGFDTAAENLSGGEKTACALAYRLALNKVINDVVTSVKTKEVLILDEPTDGFSDAQLDKVRDVLNHLNLCQIIIVSHERKVEGFVDRIMRVRKEGHVSVIVD